MTTLEIRRITRGPALVIDDAEHLVEAFCRADPSSAPGGYDDLAGRGERDRVTVADVTAINSTMRARSPHSVWEAVTAATSAPAWLRALDPDWELITVEGGVWIEQARPAVQLALDAMVAPGRGLSVATKILHLKRPRMFPVLDSLVLQQLGVTDSVGPMTVVDHLRTEGQRNLDVLRCIQQALAPAYERSLIRIMDVLLWSSHPAAGLAPSLSGWQHVVRRVEG